MVLNTFCLSFMNVTPMKSVQRHFPYSWLIIVMCVNYILLSKRSGISRRVSLHAETHCIVWTAKCHFILLSVWFHFYGTFKRRDNLNLKSLQLHSPCPRKKMIILIYQIIDSFKLHPYSLTRSYSEWTIWHSLFSISRKTFTTFIFPTCVKRTMCQIFKSGEVSN